ncbi:MAG: hypothetical protein IJG80_03725 [Selenomonadaceae bacterium]|nr:hypothetical protein [Selenomonadaceae bacterium]MBQ3726348.1 hypothetical protein [Selenomonadaceae bacterium]MBQ9498428.1 hypothetical protein [Selenomonadaceae bacterium]
MAGVMEEIAERVRQDTTERVRRETAKRVRRETTLKNTIDMAKKMLAESDLSIEKISSLCKLPLEKVQELAAEKVVSD